MSSIHPHHVAGYASETERARYLADLFASAGVPTDEMQVNDAQELHNAHRRSVYVAEGVDGDMAADQYSAFMTLAHALVRDAKSDENTRFGPSVDGVFVAYDHTDRLMSKPTTPAEAGEQLADPSEIMSDDTEQSDESAEQSTESADELAYDEQVIWAGGHEYVVETTAGWHRVDLAHDALDTVDDDVLKVLALAVPATFEADERLSMAHIELVAGAIDTVQSAQQIVQAGGGAAGGSAGGASGGGDDDGELVRDVPNDYDEYDLDALETQIVDWIGSYAEFNDDLDTEIVEISTALVKGSVGFHIDTNPFSSGYHDGDDWNDQDGYETAQEAFRDLMQDTDEIDYYGEPDYVNHLPAAKVEDVV